MSNFAFLQPEWAALHGAAIKAEELANTDARTACFYARRTLELAVVWLYKHDKALRLPYQDHLSALIHEPTFKATAGDAVFTKAKLIKDLGNLAVHSTRPILRTDALTATRELFHVCYWLARTYGQRARPAPDLRFDGTLLPLPPTSTLTTPAAPQQSVDQLQKLQAQLHARDDKLSALLSANSALDAALQALRAEVAAAKKANTAQPDTHDYSEAETRDYFIDLLLKEAGWQLGPSNLEVEVAGMPNNQGKGFVDYVLWGDDGKPLALVEAKRTRRDATVGQQQAKLYADCLQAQYGQRPIIFYSNGYEHWLWDDASYPPRAVQGFFKKPELALLIQRRTSRKRLADALINDAIINRYYQHRAVRRIGETFEAEHQRKALLVMATGGGKTRVVVALSDVLMRCNWAKRILFLADRVALVKQAVNAFKTHLPDSAPVNLLTDKAAEGRVFVSTYATMMGLIDDAADGQRHFGVGHFDLIIIDEAHRSVYQKYRAIFEYFDALLVGLTATPKDEIDHNTYGLFDLESGVPTDVYGLDEAVAEGYLVPPQAMSVPLKYQREGIWYQDLSEQEKEQWDALEWDEEGNVPDAVDSAALNKWLFNTDTVDKVLAHLMTHGDKVAGGDRLFRARLAMIAELDQRQALAPAAAKAQAAEARAGYAATLTDAQLRAELSGQLHQQVAAMNLDNFVVRPRRKTVAHFANPESWHTLSADSLQTLSEQVADLPTALQDNDEEAKRFDMLVLRTQLAILQAQPGYTALRDQLQAITGALEAQAAIPAIQAEMLLIQAMAGDEWWDGVTLAMLETARKKLRALVKLMEKSQKKVVFTDFEDELGEGTTVQLPGITMGMDLARFKDKARQFLRAHDTHLSLQRLRRNQPLTASDLAALEQMLLQAGGTTQLIQQAAEQSQGLGIFIRSLVGLDREAATQAFSQFVSGTTATASQLEFITLIVEYLTENGVMAPARLYESPFTDISQQGPEAVFSAGKVTAMVQVLDEIRRRAVG